MDTSVASEASSPSWLKQRSTIFNSSNSPTLPAVTSPKPVKKVVDKELASLKKIGAVSSVWSNKFVQEDNSGGSVVEHKKAPSPMSFSPSLSPLSPRRSRFDTSPRPNADYIPVTGHHRQSFNQPTSPRSPKFERIRPLSSSKFFTEDVNSLQQAIESQHQPQQEPQQRHQKQPSGSVSSLANLSMSSLDLNEMEDRPSSATRSSRSSTSSTSEFSSVRRPSVPVTAPASTPAPAPVASAQANAGKTSASDGMDEATKLWFQCETLKTQYAQMEARLKRANDDIDFYKRQMEQQGEVARESVTNALKEKEQEVARVRQLVELIIKQDQLLNEYETSVSALTQLASDPVHKEKTLSEMATLRQEFAAMKKQKDQLEGTVSSLRAELEMSQSQMMLMMAVSTEIQNEYDSYKIKINNEITTLLKQKEAEHEAALQALQEELTAKQVNVMERSIVSESKESQDEKEEAVAKEMEVLRQQIIALTGQLEEKDKTVLDLETQLRNQKMSMDTQMMEFTQTILEKDALLMEFMSNRNNSREALTQQQQQQHQQQQEQQPKSDIPTVTDTTNFYQPQQQQEPSEARLQMSVVRDYMYTSSDDEEEEMNYTSEEDEDDTHHYQLMNIEPHSSVPQSPADSVSSSISSTISFDSSEEEEKIAEIKHFSYSSVQSQATRPVSVISTTDSITAGQEMMNDVNHRLSGAAPARFSIAKDTNSSNWPMPPPTPPPSEPLPPVPIVPATTVTPAVATPQEATDSIKKEDNRNSLNSIVPPPRRARSKTMARAEAPDMSAVYTTSIHQKNDLPRIIPLQKDMADPSAPIPPPRKDLSRSLNIHQQPHTKWMDDPESEEDDLWCETSSAKQPVAAL